MPPKRSRTMILVLGLLALFGAAPVERASTDTGPRPQVTLQLARRKTVAVAPAAAVPPAAHAELEVEVPLEPGRGSPAAYLLHHAFLI